jgi:thiol-disulfide isomerase/thioredoxin
MKKTTIILVLALLCLNFSTNAQTNFLSLSLGKNRGGDTALKVGDKVPEGFWEREHTIYQNGKTTTTTLAAYKGKLLILDFWATWCSTCYKKLPYLDSLAKTEQNQLGIVMVNTIQTKDDLAKIKSRLTKYLDGKTLGLATIYGDDYLLRLFPHGVLSHYVWINKLGQVAALTNADLVNPTSIALSINRLNKP